MPLYEFFCDQCRDRFEKLCRQNGENQVHCPRCGTGARKVFSTFRTGKTGSGETGVGGGSSCGSCSSTSCSTCG